MCCCHCFRRQAKKKTNGIRTHCNKSEGKWKMTDDVLVENFKESGHPKFRGTSELNRGFLKRKGGIFTVHFAAKSSNADLLFRTNHSANHLSINGAAASWCEQLSNAFEHGEICCEDERSGSSKIGTARSGLLDTDTKEE